LTNEFTGSDGRRRGVTAAIPARGLLSHGERRGAQLGRHVPRVGLHVRAQKDGHRSNEHKDPADRAAHESHKEP